MLICDNCGNTVPDGRKFCGKCGKPVVPLESAPDALPAGPEAIAFQPGQSIGLQPDAGIDMGMEMFDPAKQDREQQKLTGLGFSQENAQEAELTAQEASKQNRLAPRKAGSNAATEAAAPADDEEAFVAQMLAEAANKKKKKKKMGPIHKEPVFWLAIGTLILIPALMMPWFYFYEGEPLSAFRLPVVFLFTDRLYLAPWLTVGVLISAMFVINAALIAYPKRIVTFMQVFAYISILLAAGMLLLGLRHWHAWQKMGKVYELYLQHRMVVLPVDPLPQLQLVKRPEFLPASGTVQVPQTGAPGVPAAAGTGAVRRPPIVARKNARQAPNPGAGAAVQGGAGESRLVTPGELATVTHVPAGKLATSFLGFMLSVIGTGFLFSLLSGIVILKSSTRYANKLRHIEFQIPATPAALLIVFGSFALILFLFARISPARWYYTENEILRMVGRPDAGERRLKVCIESPSPDYLCRKSLARNYWEQNKLRDALALYMDVIKERPDFPDAHHDLADFYFNSKDYWRATDQYRKYLNLRPASMAAREKLSKSLIYIANQSYVHHKYRKAAAYYEEALKVVERNKTNPVIQYKAGESFYRIGRYADASVHYAVSADLQPQDFELQVKVAKLFEARRDFGKALEYYKKAIAAREDQTLVYVYIGNLYRDRLEDKSKAAEWYQKGIDANPVSAAAPDARKALDNLK
jgi:tetratricopeptide (TPR) repeat protein